MLLVLPGTPLEPGSEHDIEIAHEGKVIQAAGHDVYFVGSRGTWYPNRGVQFAKFDVTLRYPKTLDLVAAGQVKEDRVEGDMRITRRVPDGPVRLLGFNLGQYERTQLERSGISIEVVANKQLEDALLRSRRTEVTSAPPLPQTAKARTRGSTGLPDFAAASPAPLTSPVNEIARLANNVDKAMEFYRSKFGDPPLKRIEISPVPGKFGQGFSGMIYLPTVAYVSADDGGSIETVQQRIYFHDLLLAHEIAHQWWGNLVTSGSYHHEWLMEALANYSAVMYLESVASREKGSGSKATEMALDYYRKQLLVRGPDGETAESEGAIVQGHRLDGSNNPAASNAVIYGKGTWIMHMLRRLMGDQRFLAMLAELRHRYEWKSLDTEGFRALCVEFLPPGSTDPKLENFFDQWVYGTGVPTLKLTSSVKGKPGAYKLSGTLIQADVPDDFTLSVPVEIQTPHGKTIVQMVHTSSDPAQFTVNVPGPASKAVLDPGWSVFRR